jgi:hypothetical protein
MVCSPRINASSALWMFAPMTQSQIVASASAGTSTIWHDAKPIDTSEIRHVGGDDRDAQPQTRATDPVRQLTVVLGFALGRNATAASLRPRRHHLNRAA